MPGAAARRLLIAAVLGLSATRPALADPEADRRAIVARLDDWAAAFNAGDAGAACALFAADVVAITPTDPQAGREVVCARIRAALATPGLRLHYASETREVILAGDLAVVRLFWVLTAQRAGQPAETTREAGLDIFRREPDGAWVIARFMSFDTRPGAGR